jgi:uncharacterized membrane protein HdeD (DUF308 family)
MSKSSLAIVLIVLGILALTYQGFSYTKREKAVDMGPLQISVDKEKTVLLPPIIGGLLLVSGVALLISAKRQ